MTAALSAAVVFGDMSLVATGLIDGWIKDWASS
jgi:hypothetical protein